MSIPETMKVFILAEPPRGDLTDKTFSLETKPAPQEKDLKDNQLIVKVEALSNDPAQRMWMAPGQNRVSLSLYPGNLRSSFFCSVQTLKNRSVDMLHPSRRVRPSVPSSWARSLPASPTSLRSAMSLPPRALGPNTFLLTCLHRLTRLRE